jgi:DNA-binding LacI/PurR family transcriptional regulator
MEPLKLLNKSRVRGPAIATELRQRVISGHWKPRQQILTEHQLAREFGVSRGTVIRCLRELEREGLIWSRRGEGRYVSDLTQRPKTEVIGVVIADMSLLGHPVLAAELAGIRQVCSGANYHLQIFALNKTGPTDVMARMTEQFEPSRLDGAIMISWLVSEEKIIELSRRIPIVWRARPLALPRIGSLIHDLSGGMLDAVEHLLALGHREIALATVGEDKLQGWQQREGVRLGMRRVIAAGDGRLQVISSESNRSTEWLAQLRDALFSKSRPTAVLFGSDDLAISALPLIDELNLRIPTGLSIVSQNDTLQPPQVPVPLTTIRCDYEDMGRRGARMLLRMINDPLAGRENEIVPTELVIRESTAAPPR